MDIQLRREFVFMVITGVFIGSLTMMNIIGITRFIDLSFTLFGLNVPMLIPVGVLPYPITFLCTDIVCELYGKKRANLLVWAGLIATIWIFFSLWFTGLLPKVPAMEAGAKLPDSSSPQYVFYAMRLYALGGIVGSMVAYVCAQFLDVYLFHFWRKLTNGRHLWLRNNGSTLISQLVDTMIVITASFFFVQGFPIEEGNSFVQLITIIFSAYVFKMLVALLDTIPFYIIVIWLRRYLQVESNQTIAQLSD